MDAECKLTLFGQLVIVREMECLDISPARQQQPVELCFSSSIQFHWPFNRQLQRQDGFNTSATVEH